MIAKLSSSHVLQVGYAQPGPSAYPAPPFGGRLGFEVGKHALFSDVELSVLHISANYAFVTVESQFGGLEDSMMACVCVRMFCIMHH